MPGSEGMMTHFGYVRLRVTGSGNLQMRLLSLDEILSYDLQDLVMTATSSRELGKPANFTVQRACFELAITEIDEYFVISKIVLFAKPVWSGLPG